MARVLVKSIAVPSYNEATQSWTLGVTGSQPLVSTRSSHNLYARTINLRNPITSVAGGGSAVTDLVFLDFYNRADAPKWSIGLNESIFSGTETNPSMMWYSYSAAGYVGGISPAGQWMLGAATGMTTDPLLVQGWSSAGGAHISGGSIKLGGYPASGARLQHNDAGNTVTYLDSIYDNATTSMKFRMRAGGTPIEAISIAGTGVCTLGDTANASFPGNNIVGKKDGVLTTAGMVGEIPTSTISAGTNGNAYWDSTTTTLVGANARVVGRTVNKGVYLVIGQASCGNSSASQMTAFLAVGATQVTSVMAGGVGPSSNGNVVCFSPVIITADATEITLWAGCGGSPSSPKHVLAILRIG